MSKHLYPFPATEPPADGAVIPLDSRGFADLAADCETYPPCSPCDPIDIPELTSQLTKVFESRVKVLLSAGLRAPTLPGRLDPLVWYIEDTIGTANGFGLSEETVYTCAEREFPAWSHFLIGAAIRKWRDEGSHYAPNTASNAVAAARVAKDEARRQAREATALAREIVARKVTDATPNRLGCLVVRWLIAGDRSAMVQVDPQSWRQATPLLLTGGLDCADGTTLFCCAPSQSAGLAIKGKVEGPDWELVSGDEALPAEFTGSQWASAVAANRQLPGRLWAAIKQARVASTDLSAMTPDGGLDEDTLMGRAAIALGRERLRMMKALNVNIFRGGAYAWDQSPVQLAALIEWLSRGLDLNVLVVRDLLLESEFGDAKRPGNWADTSDLRVRQVLKARAQGAYLSPRECLPRVAGNEDMVSSGDAFEDVLSPLCQGRSEVLRSDCEIALRAAGVATVFSNILSGRITKTMGRLGFATKTLMSDGHAVRGYARQVQP